MRRSLKGVATAVGVASMVGGYLAVPQAASAAGSAPVPFTQAKFSGYGTGDEIHLGAVSTGSIQLADLEQAFSGATTATAGLAASLTDTDTGQVVQPAEAAGVHAYGMGDGLEIGLGASTTGVDANQILLAGKAESTAPPNSPEVIKSLSPGAIPGLGTIGLLDGRAASLYGATCPIGQPISYGLGDAANAQLLPVGGIPVIDTAGTGTSTAHTDSETYLNSNGDGTFGLATSARETIAPLTVNLGPASLQITVSGESINNPVTLQAITTGEATGAQVKLLNDALIGINLVAAGQTIPLIPSISLQALIGQGGINLPLNLSQLATSLSTIATNLPNLSSILDPVVTQLTGALAPVLAALPNVSLGDIQLGTPPTSATSGGTSATGDFNIAKVQVGGTGTLLPSILNFELGHLQAAANDASPITCPIPVIKTADPSTVSAGNNFVYTIQVPDPAKLEYLACSLDHVSVVDTLADDPNGGGAPTFQILKVNDNGVIDQTSPTNATVTWKGLTYHIAPVGAPPNPPITLHIFVHVPQTSPVGEYLDNVNVTADYGQCTGGATGIAGLGQSTGQAAHGSFTLVGPRVVAPTTPLAATSPAAGTGEQSLPKTGGHGGLWQPGLGLGVLIVGGGALELVRRSRRRPGGSPR